MDSFVGRSPVSPLSYLQAALMIYTMVPMSRRLEKLNTLAAQERNFYDHSSYWGFKIFRDKFIELHQLPRAFLFDLYHLQHYNVRPLGVLILGMSGAAVPVPL
jgi:hypothetical protein